MNCLLANSCVCGSASLTMTKFENYGRNIKNGRANPVMVSEAEP